VADKEENGMGLQIYLDGKIVDESEAKVSVFDHGLLYGDGVFEGIRAYSGNVFRLQEHLQRLYDSARVIGLTIPMTRVEMEEAVLQTLRANQLRDGYIRLVVTRGRGDLGLDPRKCPRATVFIIASSITLYPQKYYDEGLKIITGATRRIGSDALSPRVKSLNYLNNIMAKIEGNNAGVPETLMLNRDGYVVECTGDNIFVVRDRQIVTPPAYLGALSGVTRSAVIEIAAQLKLSLKEEPFTLYEIYTADECFLSGSAAEVIPVVEIDGRMLGTGKPGPVFASILEEFRKLTTKDGTPI